MPAALTVASAGAGSGPTEESKGEPTVNQTTGQEPASSEFSPLQDLSAAVALHDPFVHMKVSDEAESSNQSSQGGHTNCLRWSPTLSSDHVVITENGKCASVFQPVSYHTITKFYRADSPARVFTDWTTYGGFHNQAQIKLVNNNCFERQALCFNQNSQIRHSKNNI